MRVVKICNRLPREAVGSLSLEMFKMTICGPEQYLTRNALSSELD